MTTASGQVLLIPVRGGSLVAAIEAACATHGVSAGWVRAIGEVRDVVLSRSAQGASSEQSTYARQAPASLLSFDGSVALLGDTPTLRANALIALDADGASHVVGGALIDAEAVDVELFITPSSHAATRTRRGGLRLRSDTEAEPAGSTSTPSAAAKRAPAPAPAPAPKSDAASARSAAPRRSEPPAARPEREPAEQPPSPQVKRGAKRPKARPAVDWSAVEALSNQIESGETGEDVDVEDLQRGDVLLHPTLNQCTVVQVLGDDALRVRVPNGAVRKLMMRPFRLLQDGSERVFRIEKKSKS